MLLFACTANTPRSPLYGSARLAHRSVALWELRLFFPQREDRDMERQLGFSRDPTGDRTSLGLAAACAIGATSFAATTPVTALAAASAPFLYLTGLAVAPGAVRGALDAVALRLVPAIRERQAFHEAGHVVVGYLAGLPVDAAAVGGDAAVSFGEPSDAAVGDAVDVASVVSMAGIAGEVIGLGDAEGGAADVAQLRELLQQARPGLNRRAADDRIRWATLMALTLLNKHRGEHERVAAVLREGGDAAACLDAIETRAEILD